MNICKYCIVGGALLGLVACRSTAPADKPAVVRLRRMWICRFA